MKFTEFNLNDNILEAISYMGFENASPIQEKAIPAILEDKDLIACAQTGTGKTAAFTLPILHKLNESNTGNGVKALIIVPIRELAVQIDQQIQGFSYFVPATSMPVYGGRDGSDWDMEKRALTGDCDIIITTPGKMIAHLNMGYVKLEHLEHLILDEADKMLEMGFYDDIMKIVSYLPKKRQTLMFSATMPPKIRELARSILNKPEEITIELSKPAEGVLQVAYLIDEENKMDLIHELIKDKPEYNSILIFTSTKSKVSSIVRSLRRKNHDVEGISSDLEQDEREEVLKQFGAKHIRILIATDVISRGIDIKDINLIINYDVPNDSEAYVHRVGRTARAATTGVAITMICKDDMYKFAEIESLIEREVLKLPTPEHIGDSPEWRVKTKKKKTGKYYKRKPNNNRNKNQNKKNRPKPNN